MFIISCLTSRIICFTHWEKDKHLRGSGFGQVSWKPVTKHEGNIQGKVLLKKRLNPELSFFCSLATCEPGCRGRLANTAPAVRHQHMLPICSWWLSPVRDTWSLSAGFGGKVLETSQGIMIGSRAHKSLKEDFAVSVVGRTT